MERDFRSELAGERCWDRGVQEVYEARGEPLVDCVLQNREELIALCELIEQHRVRSYLEIGVWTGRLVRALHRLFGFQLVAACDDGYAERHGLSIELPRDARWLCADSGSAHFERFRGELGHVDLVLIDADHHYASVRRDFLCNLDFPHRFIAFHDIAGEDRRTAGVRKLWAELAGQGFRRELVRPHRELGLDRTTMGIGIWSATERP